MPYHRQVSIWKMEEGGEKKRSYVLLPLPWRRRRGGEERGKGGKPDWCRSVDVFRSDLGGRKKRKEASGISFFNSAENRGGEKEKKKAAVLLPQFLAIGGRGGK